MGKVVGAALYLAMQGVSSAMKLFFVASVPYPVH